MKEPLDELYLTWLYSQVANVKAKDPSKTCWGLLRQLYAKEFVWLVPNDDNRVEDGKDLRYEFIDDSELEDVDLHWVDLGCSMLELLVGLSRRLAFEAEGEPRAWFWRLMENLGIRFGNDRQTYPSGEVDEILDQVIFRTYTRTGQGGLFPLTVPEEDQRKVELWYQLSAYLLERE